MLATGLKREKIDQWPSNVLLALWKQLPMEQKFQRLWRE